MHEDAGLDKADRRIAVSVDEAARILGAGRTMIYDEIRSARLRSFKVGSRRFISVAALEEWVHDAENRATA